MYQKFSEALELKTSKFTISFLGTIYPIQDISIAINGLKKFLADKKMNEIQINFIGTAVFPEIERRIRDNLPAEAISITGRIPREKAVQKLLKSNIKYLILSPNQQFFLKRST